MNQFASGPVLLTGGSGFIGSHVRRLLQSRGTPVRVLAHHADADSDEVVWGNLADPASLRGICAGVTTVVHTASVINGSEEACRTVNERGTAALVAEARRAGVRRLVYVSTAAVYGDGVHQGIAENAVAPEPVSPTSRSRLMAESSVLAAGGTVLRPMFVYGAGDRWFVPAVAELARRLSARLAGGRARLSLISVHALAEAVCAVARLPTARLEGATLHAAHPAPTTLAEILDVLVEEALVPTLADEIGYEQAVAELGQGMSRRLGLLGFDHYYDSARLWQAVDVSAGPGFLETYPHCAQWYREVISAALPKPASGPHAVHRPGPVR
ncbi:NAD-dependent epimerase/dehydratase family protein [Streptomyces sp. NPDC002928]|uniref:NAD-dependent epimerase/dehydratase family protein n=1 Tax=Streptomyces sp. NPDC002928 TaxID=3154440 RepID=UPI0033B156C8